MVSVFALWLPIVLAAVLVFVASSVIHMVLPYHKSDMRKMDGEEAVLAAMRSAGVKPGEYMFPMCKSMKDMNDPEYVAKLNHGPVGTMTVMPNGPWNMGRSLGQWFAFCLVLSVFVAYITGMAMPRGADVFRMASTVGVLAYAFTNVTNSIWKGSAWSNTCKFVFDGLVYGLVTGATFAWLWPAAT